MIELPHVFRERWIRRHQPGDGVARTRDPAIVIDATVCKHLEVLSGMRLLRLRVVEGIDHRCSIKTSLRGPVHALWKRQARRFKNSGRNIRHVSELGTKLSLGLDSCRPLNHDTVGRSAIMRCDLLCPLKWRIARPSPADGIMWK